MAARALEAKATRTVSRGDRLRVVVRSLAPGEQVTLKVGRTRIKARANAHGMLRRGVRITAAPGRLTVRIRGAYAVRSDTLRIRVTR